MKKQLPTAQELVHKFLCEKRYPVTLIEPRVSLGKYTYVSFGWIGFYPSLDGKSRASDDTFAIDLAKTNLEFSFSTNCAGVNLGIALEKAIIDMVNEQFFAGKKLYLLPTNEEDSSCRTCRLFSDSETVGIVENGPFQIYSRIFPDGSKEATAVDRALNYEQKLRSLKSPPVAHTTKKDVDAAAAELELALSA